jgi:nitrate reductase NapA
MTTTGRRTFLKRTALASAAAAAASLMPDVLFGETLRQHVGAASDVVWKKTPCGFCGVGCGLLR